MLKYLKLFGISSITTVKEIARKRNIPYVCTQFVPDPIKNTDLEIVRLAQKDINQKGYVLNSMSIEGYIAAAIFVDLLKKIEGDITKEKIIEQAEKLKNYDFMGLKLDFDPQTRSISKGVWINPGTEKPFLYIPEEKGIMQPAQIKQATV